MSPEIVLLDRQDRYFRAAVLKAHGYRVFTTEHVVDACLRWVSGNSAALVIGPQIPLQEVATLCDWIKINSPEKPILVLSDRRSSRWPAHVDVLLPSQPVQALLKQLCAMLPSAGDRSRKKEADLVRANFALGISSRLRSS